MASRIPPKIVALVMARDGGLCVLRISRDCLGVASCADHRANRGSGGAGQRLNQPSNLLAACGPCNGLKEDSHGEVREELERRGIRLRSSATHALTAIKARVIPVVYPDGRSFYLLDDGTREEEDVGEDQEHGA